MSGKKIVTIALLVFAGCSVAYLIAGEIRGRSEVADSVDAAESVAPAETTRPVETQAPPANPVSKSAEQEVSVEKAPDAEQQRTVIAYYFHGDVRCVTCKTIEAYTQEAIEQNFADTLADVRLQWRAVNVDQPQNRHFIKDYQLYTKSVVLVEMQGGRQVRWENLEKVWQLVRDKDAFMKYVCAEVGGFVEAG